LGYAATELKRVITACVYDGVASVSKIVDVGVVAASAIERVITGSTRDSIVTAKCFYGVVAALCVYGIVCICKL